MGLSFPSYNLSTWPLVQVHVLYFPSYLVVTMQEN